MFICKIRLTECGLFDIISFGENMKFLNKYNINIKNEELFLTAVTHSSYSNEHNCENYERLEFLGDAVLSAVTSKYLFTNYNLNEGEMSKKRAKYVCESALYQYSKDIGSIPYIRVGKGQKDNVNKTIIADTFEAIIGVIFLEKGFNVAEDFIYTVVIPYIEKDYHFLDDYKSALQELVQTSKKSLEYRLVSEEGPAHDKTFVIEVVIDDIVYGRGKGKSKKEAEQQAAYDAFKKQAK